MKTMNFFKSIIIMMVALVAMSANAQELVNGIDTRNAKACGEYLVNNPKDTLVSESTFSIEGVDYVVYHKVFLNGGRLVQGHNVLGQRRDTVKILLEQRSTPEMLEKIKRMDSIFVQSRFEESLVNYGQKRLYTYYTSKDVGEYRNAQNRAAGLPEDPNADKGIKSAVNQFGFGVFAQTGLDAGNDIFGAHLGLGIMYQQYWWSLSLQGQAAVRRYSSKAINAKKEYPTFRAETTFMLHPFRMGKYDLNCVYLLGGLCYEYFRTGSMPYQYENNGDMISGCLSSKGNDLYGTVGVGFRHQFFSTGSSLDIKLQWRGTEAVVQNAGAEDIGTFSFSVAYTLPVFPAKVQMK